MSYYRPNTGGPPPYQSSSLILPQKSPRTMQIVVNLVANQCVEIRLNVNSPWIVGVVLTVLSVVEKSFGFEYEIRYQSGNRAATKIFPANSPNIRVPEQ